MTVFWAFMSVAGAFVLGLLLVVRAGLRDQVIVDVFPVAATQEPDAEATQEPDAEGVSS